MNGTKLFQRLAIVPIVALSLTVAGCNKQADNGTTTTPTTTANTSTTTTAGKNTTLNYSKNSPLDTTNMFTQTDFTQTVDTTTAKKITLEDGKDVAIDAAGTYVITGTAKNSTVIVNASADAEVHLVFDNASITNTNKPTVYAVNAKNVYVTTTQNSTNNLKVTGEFTEDDGKNIDAVIFAKTNITLNGLGTLNIDSSANGVASNNDLKVTGGTYNINTTKHGFKALNSIRVADGTFNINAKKDGFHSENEDDLTTGYVYISLVVTLQSTLKMMAFKAQLLQKLMVVHLISTLSKESKALMYKSTMAQSRFTLQMMVSMHPKKLQTMMYS